MKDYEEIIERWKRIVEQLQRSVTDIGFTECVETDGYCSSQTMHAIIHVNQARKELEQCIEILQGKYENLTSSS